MLQVIFDLFYYFEYLKSLSFSQKEEILVLKGKIVFISYYGGEIGLLPIRIPDIYIMKTDGSNVKRLLMLKLVEYQVVCSPDGKKLAIAAMESPISRNLYIIDVSGKNLIQLTKDGDNKDPCWSSDGKNCLCFQPKIGK